MNITKQEMPSNDVNNISTGITSMMHHPEIKTEEKVYGQIKAEHWGNDVIITNNNQSKNFNKDDSDVMQVETSDNPWDTSPVAKTEKQPESNSTINSWGQPVNQSESNLATSSWDQAITKSETKPISNIPAQSTNKIETKPTTD